MLFVAKLGKKIEHRPYRMLFFLKATVSYGQQNHIKSPIFPA
ncbi:hypothetical protein HMPREF3226_00546 [Prevotella corporis]|uniref:Uncharacterized protein n=1 Tax=Prevotella corporis TaxID=28128 RepID=A0A133QJF1_9BACT|nr:hypothetical protein HMPREF3226_00546 [Prevotella corporis]